MCSVTRWSQNGVAEVVARNMDWLEDMKSNLWLFPRGIKREGLAGKNSLTWTSKYGSIITAPTTSGQQTGLMKKILRVTSCGLQNRIMANETKVFLDYPLACGFSIFSITLLLWMRLYTL